MFLSNADDGDDDDDVDDLKIINYRFYVVHLKFSLCL